MVTEFGTFPPDTSEKRTCYLKLGSDNGKSLLHLNK
jgi:hypothetical protein